MIRNASVLEEFFRRGWINPAAFLAGQRYAEDLATAGREPMARAGRGERKGNGHAAPAADHVVAARERIKRAETHVVDFGYGEVVPLLVAVLRDNQSPGAWVQARGVQARDGILLLRRALALIGDVYLAPTP